MTKKNPFDFARDAAELTLASIFGLAFLALVVYGLVIMPFTGDWIGWGVVLAFVVLVSIGFLVDKLFSFIARKWRKASWEWERKHREEVR